jgi:hypothetical protein
MNKAFADKKNAGLCGQKRRLSVGGRGMYSRKELQSINGVPRPRRKRPEIPMARFMRSQALPALLLIAICQPGWAKPRTFTQVLEDGGAIALTYGKSQLVFENGLYLVPDGLLVIDKTVKEKLDMRFDSLDVTFTEASTFALIRFDQKKQEWNVLDLEKVLRREKAKKGKATQWKLLERVVFPMPAEDRLNLELTTLPANAGLTFMLTRAKDGKKHDTFSLPYKESDVGAGVMDRAKRAQAHEVGLVVLKAEEGKGWIEILPTVHSDPKQSPAKMRIQISPARVEAGMHANFAGPAMQTFLFEPKSR